MGNKIMIGYGSDKRTKNPKRCYGTRSSGKKMINGGFNFAPTEDFHNIPEDKWNKIFPNGFKPSWIKNSVKT